ncbi:toll/interleukin-1 receptor domain-containing protein [Paenibacillus sp. FSL R10-2734]|uniref:toll/interleukin-1 receptor domain-containing protein n=1 Tax=Paenibacillus sp. FSL R10-2734 TaxID=2954691 RepID=UPI0030D860CE
MSSIFLSHNSNDKPFVRKLAKDLQRKGYYVWVDEAEIKIGDSLITKIREGIDKVMFVGVVLSKNSINSEWVKREVDIAMNQEIEGKVVKVLPIMLESVELPGFLKGKLYADFTSKESYKHGLKLLMDRLDEVPSNVTEPTISRKEAELLMRELEEVRKKLDVTNGEKRMLLDRLAIERSAIPDNLLRSIESEKDTYPELDDINRNFAFTIEGTTVTAGYVLHAIRKERMKGSHVLSAYSHAFGKDNELALLIEAITRRLNKI